MGEPTKGTDTLEKMDESWFIVSEAECVDDINTLDELFDESTDGSCVSNLIEDDVEVDETDEGNSLALFNKQISEECENAICALKRKYVKSPQQVNVAELSPRLEAVRITPERQSKRRLFHDSGLGDDEAENSITQVETLTNLSQAKSGAINNGAELACKEIMICSNKRAKLLSKFAEYFGVPYTELTRNFKSDKTCNENWIVAVFAVADEILEASKVVLANHCDFFQLTSFNFAGLFLMQFKHAKNRETIVKLFTSVFNLQPFQLLCDPPKIKSVPTALWFYKKAIAGQCYMHGSLPDWVQRQTMVNHQAATAAETFDLSVMIQWAYDNNLTEEAQVAYNYALLADEDSNAAAFLNSNQQVRFVRDCTQMVRLYKRQEMREMSMSEWIFKCCDECEGEADWKVIGDFLKFQNVSIVGFLTALRTFFKQIPKKQAILIHGPPDTGKSYFAFSMVKFLRGKVVSYVNKSSQFWLSPLSDCKIGFLDDATHPCWSYMDQNMRNALDGNPMCIDLKHRAPQQLKLPPMMITSNVDVLKEPTLLYLHSRLMSFEFANKMPFDSYGNPIYEINDKHWKCFFRRLAKQLDLSIEEDNEPIRPERAFKCTAKCSDDPL